MDYENKETLPEETSSQEPIDEQTTKQTGQKRIHVDFDERNLRTSYANGFRTTATEEEVVLDFGVNHIQASSQQTGGRKMVFQPNERIIMNYYSAKRLTITLGQIIHRHEQEFGEIELDAAKRRSGQKK
jgi:hypothetical protein